MVFGQAIIFFRAPPIDLGRQKLPVLTGRKGGDNRVIEQVGLTSILGLKLVSISLGVHDYDDKSPHY